MNCLSGMPECLFRPGMENFLFVEKLSFSLPYQVIKFDNRKQLYQYLMGMYDTQWGQKEAKPFIMENTRRMKC